MKKTVSGAEGAAETATPEGMQVENTTATAPTAPNPTEGGRYQRNPVTGELTKVED